MSSSSACKNIYTQIVFYRSCRLDIKSNTQSFVWLYKRPLRQTGWVQIHLHHWFRFTGGEDGDACRDTDRRGRAEDDFDWGHPPLPRDQFTISNLISQSSVHQPSGPESLTCTRVQQRDQIKRKYSTSAHTDRMENSDSETDSGSDLMALKRSEREVRSRQTPKNTTSGLLLADNATSEWSKELKC